MSEAISSTKSENGENNDESPVDSLQQISEYLYYLDQFSNIKKKMGREDKLVRSFDNLADRRYIIEMIVKIFDKMNLFKTLILLDNLYDINSTFDIYSDFDFDTIDIHSEDFFENIKMIFESIIKR